jgi:hypothetical protein
MQASGQASESPTAKPESRLYKSDCWPILVLTSAEQGPTLIVERVTLPTLSDPLN